MRYLHFAITDQTKDWNVAVINSQTIKFVKSTPYDLVISDACANAYTHVTNESNQSLQSSIPV